MKDFIKDNLIFILFGGWLGGCLAIMGFSMYTWQYWFVFIPTAIFFVKKH